MKRIEIKWNEEKRNYDYSLNDVSMKNLSDEDYVIDRATDDLQANYFMNEGVQNFIDSLPRPINYIMKKIANKKGWFID